MPSTLDNYIQLFLLQPESLKDIPITQTGILAVFAAPEVLRSGLLPSLSKSYIFKAGIAQKLEHDAQWIKSYDFGLIATMQDPQALLNHALSMAKENHEFPVSIGIAYGEGITLEKGEWLGIPRFQAERMAQFGAHHQVAATQEFIDALEHIPEGVGLLSGHRSMEQIMSFPFLIVRDYR
jgi:class 3 adenylate cyclase